MKSEELEALIREELEKRELNPDVDVIPNENEYVVKFRHVEGCEGCDKEDEWLWRVGNEFVYYGQTDKETKEIVEDKVDKIYNKNEEMHARRDFPSKEFVNWLEREGSYDIPVSKVEEKFPEFFEVYNLGAVTVRMENEEQHVPVRDFIDCVKFGHPRD